MTCNINRTKKTLSGFVKGQSMSWMKNGTKGRPGEGLCCVRRLVSSSTLSLGSSKKGSGLEALRFSTERRLTTEVCWKETQASRRNLNLCKSFQNTQAEKDTGIVGHQPRVKVGMWVGTRNTEQWQRKPAQDRAVCGRESSSPYVDRAVNAQ